MVAEGGCVVLVCLLLYMDGRVTKGPESSHAYTWKELTHRVNEVDTHMYTQALER